MLTTKLLSMIDNIVVDVFKIICCSWVNWFVYGQRHCSSTAGAQPGHKVLQLRHVPRLPFPHWRRHWLSKDQGVSEVGPTFMYYSRCNLTVENGPVSTVPGYVVYHQTRDVSGQSLFSWPTCMLAFSSSLSAPIRQQPLHLTWIGQGTHVMWFSQLPC